MNYLMKDMLRPCDMLCTAYRTKGGKFTDRLDFHPHYEICFCKGNEEKRIIVNGSTYVCSCPVVVILPPYAMHHISLDSAEGDFERYVIYFNDRFLSSFSPSLLPKEMFNENKGKMILLCDAERDGTSVRIERIFASDCGENEKALAVAALLNYLALVSDASKTISPENVSEYIPRALEYIYTNAEERLDSASLAARFNVSRAKLDRDFRKYVGKSVHETVCDCKLSYAARLLRESKHTVGEIAEKCGFESEYYFYAFFKRNTGKTPMSYRRELLTDTI